MENPTNTNYFQELYNVDVTEKIKVKNGLNYISWASAWAEVKKKYPSANYVIGRCETTKENGEIVQRPWFDDGRTAWVVVSVTIGYVTHEEVFPIMNFKNQSIKAAEVTSTDANKSIKRALAKCCAEHGLGLYIYEGEDLPEETKKENKKKEEEKNELKESNDVAFNLAKEKSQINNELVKSICKKYVANGNPKAVKTLEDSKNLIAELKTIK